MYWKALTSGVAVRLMLKLIGWVRFVTFSYPLVLGLIRWMATISLSLYNTRYHNLHYYNT